MIRWTKGDYIKLGKAVANFNRQVAQNENQINKQYLPKLVDYKELRDRIQTREGLNAYIQSLKRINLPNSFTLEKLENGETITSYQKQELERGKSQAMNALQKQIRQVEAQTKLNYGIDADIKLPQAFKSIKQKELEARLKDYKNLYKLDGKAFRKRAAELGINQTELNYRRAYIFRQNYMNVMREKYKNYEDFWLFEKWARHYKNPVNFYEALPDTDFYPDDLQYQSDTTFSNEDFRGFLESLGIDVETEILNKQQRESKKQKK